MSVIKCAITTFADKIVVGAVRADDNAGEAAARIGPQYSSDSVGRRYEFRYRGVSINDRTFAEAIDPSDRNVQLELVEIANAQPA